MVKNLLEDIAVIGVSLDIENYCTLRPNFNHKSVMHTTY
ncbi:hypothetical protein yaldo0001_4370 [Yersinia aldovae ATCC 35236]|nr:hypothetical protein yaldo0001_4370 [Yersinia aldovae ATCC 35236]